MRPNLSDDDALALAKSRSVKDAIAAINEYQNKTGTKLQDHQSYAFIQDAIDGYKVKHFVYNRRNNKVAARNSRFTGLHSLVSYKSKNQIKHHAATITKLIIEMGGTEPNRTSSNWLKSIIKGTKLTTDDVDYGHIVGNHSGGSGNLSGKNGFVQDRGINRGKFRIYQEKIDDYVVNNNVKAATFATLEYGQNKDIPKHVYCEVDYSDGHLSDDNKQDFRNID